MKVAYLAENFGAADCVWAKDAISMSGLAPLPDLP